MSPGTKRASSMESNEVEAVWRARESNRRVASSNEWPHDGHDETSLEISLRQLGQRGIWRRIVSEEDALKLTGYVWQGCGFAVRCAEGLCPSDSCQIEMGLRP